MFRHPVRTDQSSTIDPGSKGVGMSPGVHVELTSRGAVGRELVQLLRARDEHGIDGRGCLRAATRVRRARRRAVVARRARRGQRPPGAQHRTEEANVIPFAQGTHSCAFGVANGNSVAEGSTSSRCSNPVQECRAATACFISYIAGRRRRGARTRRARQRVSTLPMLAGQNTVTDGATSIGEESAA